MGDIFDFVTVVQSRDELSERAANFFLRQPIAAIVIAGCICLLHCLF